MPALNLVLDSWQLLELVPEGCAVSDVLGTLIQANQVAAEMFGQPAASLPGRRLASLLGQPHRRKFGTYLKRAAHAACEPIKLDLASALPVMVTAARISLGAEHTHGFVWLLRDLSPERTQAEALRTQAVRFEQAQSFSSGGPLLTLTVGHNVGVALSAIATLAQVALEGEGLAPSSQELLRSILLCATDATESLRRLAYLHLPGGSAERETLSVNELVADSLRPVQLRLVAPGAPPVDWRTDLRSQHRVRVRANELREALTNLIQNALQAMQHGGTLTVRTWDEPDCAIVTIGDTGQGIAAQFQQRIFAPLFSTKGSHGQGLGLSAARALVERQGGTVQVLSQPGQGAVFTIRLPVLDPPSLP